MSFTLATGIGLPCGSKVDTGVQLGEHVLGEREVGGGAVAREDRVAGDDRVGEPGMLVQGPLPDLGGVGLGVEAEADLPADPAAAPRSARSAARSAAGSPGSR